MNDIIPVDSKLPVLPEDNPAVVYIASLQSESSRRVMRHALNTIAAITSDNTLELMTYPWAGLRYKHTIAIKTLLAEKYAPATVNRMLSALRRTLQEAWRLGYMSAEDYHRAVDFDGLQNEKLPTGRYVSQDEVKTMLDSCLRDSTARGIRDAAIIGVLYAGLRRAEVARLKREHYTRDTGRLVVKESKHHKDRVVFLDDGAIAALDDWLSIRGEQPGPLFTGTNQRGDIQLSGITSQTVYNVVDQRQKEAGILEPLTPHDFRRSAVSDLLDQGVDIATVANLMGHKNTDTTKRYDRRGEQTMQKAVKTRRLPYKE